MRKFLLTAAIAAVAAAAPAYAQDMAEPAPAVDTTSESAPDGSPAFGIEPYFGIMGGWEKFDVGGDRGLFPANNQRNNVDGALVQGVLGFNVPLGPVFIGAEGNVAKGVDGAIDWEYGAAGRFGFRAGDSGLFYGKVGYQWVEFDRRSLRNRKDDDITYGIGFEAGPKDIGLGGITGNAGFRIRGEVSTYGEADSFRPMLGIITHF